MQGVPASTHLRSCEDVNKFCSHTTSQKTAAAPALAAAARRRAALRASESNHATNQSTAGHTSHIVTATSVS